MIKKSIKYLLIVGINFLILTFLLVFWVDFIELTFNDWIIPFEFLKIILISFLIIIVIRIAIIFFRKQEYQLKTKIKISILITLLISSYLYINYSTKIYHNQFKSREIRKKLSSKIISFDKYPYGSKGTNLSYKEYLEITKINWFPEISEKANNISYEYNYEGFLPDYFFSLTYDIPVNIEIEIINEKNGTFSRNQKYEIIENKKRISYREDLW